MPRELADIQRDAMEPSSKESANLVEHLLATLDADEETASEELWMEEAERRHADYRAGKIASKTAEQIFTGAQNKFN